MAGLTDQAGGETGAATLEERRAAWERSMGRRLEQLRRDLRQRDPAQVALNAHCQWDGCALQLKYWGMPVTVHWPQLIAMGPRGEALAVFDHGMILYYLHQADGTPMADRWIAFRELPDGRFYHLAFQSYSGRRIAARFGPSPADFQSAARALGGWPLPDLAPNAFAFQPLPRIRLAAVLYPGDEEFPARANVLFDAAAPHYMPTDGLALLGGGLAGRLLKAAGGKSRA